MHKPVEETKDILNKWTTEGCKHEIVLKEKDKVIGHISVDSDSEEKKGKYQKLN